MMAGGAARSRAGGIVDTRKLIAEAVGTFILVGMGSLGILSSSTLAGTPVLVAVPLAFGLGLLAALAVAGHVSGGHFNPAVTLGALLDRRVDVTTAIGYVVAQVVGAVVASAMILVLSDQTTVAGTKNMPGPVGDGGAFLVEVVLTAIFVAVILTVTKKDPGHALIVIPLTLLVIHVAGIPLSGASVNPARSLGPAIVSVDFAAIWIYLTAPFLGAVVGWGVFRVLSVDE
jgi:aquaporin Z